MSVNDMSIGQRRPDNREGGIRTVAICVFRNGERILAARGRDSVTGSRFYRPLGGSVEFGETAVDAIRREIREELGQEISHPIQLGVLENIFVYEGRQCHEIVFVFDARFHDQRLYAEESIRFTEAGWDGDAVWVPAGGTNDRKLVPDGLTALLTRR